MRTFSIAVYPKTQRSRTSPFIHKPRDYRAAPTIAQTIKRPRERSCLDWIHNTAGGQQQELLPQSQLDELLDEYLRGETYSCRLKTLSEVMREEQIERIDLLKIDVESSELDVLAGIEEEDWPRIKQIAIEVHSRSILESVSSLLECTWL